ncbi:unnamed protein product [Meganyctiphanes norvegica]|uniref:Uncharacterized protein n=1 Tax=Meganyctiphanes norvegica TaxID=48144 RepID=A0AAV2PZ66_MEGNR
MAPNAAVVVPAFLLVTILYLGFSNRSLKLELNDAVNIVEREQSTKLSALKQCEDDLNTLTTDLKKLHTDFDACQVQKIAQSKDLGTLTETKNEVWARLYRIIL